MKKIKAIFEHTITKDFLFIFFNIDTYEHDKTNKEVIPLDINYYGSEILILTHLLHGRVYTIYMWFYVQINVLPRYFLFHFWKHDLWVMLNEIFLAFWVWRLPLLVVWINLAEWTADFDIWFTFKGNKRKAFYKIFKKLTSRVKKLKKLLKNVRHRDTRIKITIKWAFDKIRWFLVLFRKRRLRKKVNSILDFFQKLKSQWF